MLDVQAPPCPNWCNEHDDTTGWDDKRPTEVSKTCLGAESSVDVADGTSIAVRLARFAYGNLTTGVVRVGTAHVSVGERTELDLDAAKELARLLYLASDRGLFAA